MTRADEKEDGLEYAKTCLLNLRKIAQPTGGVELGLLTIDEMLCHLNDIVPTHGKDQTIERLKQVMAEVAFEMYRETKVGPRVRKGASALQLEDWATRLDKAVTAEILQAQEAHNAPQTE